MADINTVTLSGNLTRDPETRQLSGDNSVTNLRLASNTRRKQADGTWGDQPNYFDVTAWGKHGENIAQYLGKGDGLIVTGRLEHREYVDKDGNNRQAVSIIAEDSKFMPKNGAKRDTANSTLDDVQAAFDATSDDDIPF